MEQFTETSAIRFLAFPINFYKMGISKWSSLYPKCFFMANISFQLQHTVRAPGVSSKATASAESLLLFLNVVQSLHLNFISFLGFSVFQCYINAIAQLLAEHLLPTVSLNQPHASDSHNKTKPQDSLSHKCAQTNWLWLVLVSFLFSFHFFIMTVNQNKPNKGSKTTNSNVHVRLQLKPPRSKSTQFLGGA